MPELIEVELYRTAATRTIGRTISTVSIFSNKYLREGTSSADLRSAVSGSQLGNVRRIGKLLLLEVGTAVIGVRFGMTGRLIVDGDVTINELLYTTNEVQERHIRFSVEFDDGGTLAVIDPRGFGNVELNPDESLLGPDAMDISDGGFREICHNSKSTLKALLLDQRKISGIGNLLCDEILWRSGIAPSRISGSLNTDEIKRVASEVKDTIKDLAKRGGSHMGKLQSERHEKGVCPLDGFSLSRSTVAGRTSWWCPEHQL